MKSFMVYQVDDFDLKHVLLSPRARQHDEGYKCCESCFCSVKSSKKDERAKPPKFSIANSFAIGHIPDTLYFCDRQGNRKTIYALNRNMIWTMLSVLQSAQ